MHAALRVMTQLPAVELWRADGLVTRQRGSSLTAEDIAAFLRRGQVRFVVASAGESLRWIAPAECFAFWRSEVRPHLAAPDASIVLSDFPGEYCYFASEWAGAELPIILLETHH